MEMTYGGALVMPSSYAMMDEEEMMYLEGGGLPAWNSTFVVTGAIDALLYLVPFIGQCNEATKWGSTLCKAVKAVGKTKAWLVDGIFSLIKKVGFKVSKNVVTGIVGFVWNFAGLSIGGIIAWGIDQVDSCKNNGLCFG